MFSGLGSITDLNQQFVQFTSNLTNLDSLQDGSTPSLAQPTDSDEQTSAALRSLELANEKLTDELICQQSLVNDLKAYLAVKDDQLFAKDAEVIHLTEELKHAIEREQVATKGLVECKLQIEGMVITLAEDSTAVDVVSKKRVDKSSPTNELKVANKKIKDLERQLTETLNERHAEVSACSDGIAESASNLVGFEESRSAASAAEALVQSLQSQLAAVESDLHFQTKKYTEELISANDHIKELRSELRAKSDSAASQIEEQNVLLREKTNALRKLDTDVQTYLNNIVELNEEKSFLMERSVRAESRCAELEESLRAAQAASCLEQQQNTCSGSHDELVQLKELAETRARMVQEAEGKVSTLTEKLKDMMHRFAELKAKSGSQIQQLEERLADITKIAQAKDSEILGLKLKMENSERSGSDIRLKVNELAERYGEAQREITRLRTIAEERIAEMAILTEQRDLGVAALQTCETQRDEVTQRLCQVEEQAATEQATHESSIQELKAELIRQKEVSEEQLLQLRAELEAAHGRLRLEEDSAGNLDNYKKRAQLALKKANTANASLSAEVQQLQTALEEASTRLNEAQATAKMAADELAALNNITEALRAEKQSLEKDLVDMQQLALAKEQDYASRQSEVQKQLLQQFPTSSHFKQRKENGSDDVDDDVDEDGKRVVDFCRSVPGSVSQPPGVDAAAAAVDSHLMSSPPSYATDTPPPTAASQDSGSSNNNSSMGDNDSDTYSHIQSHNTTNNNNIKSLGGSSWAMVAASSASVSESRLTSTHPSSASLLAAAADDHDNTRPQHPQATASRDFADVDEPSDFRATPLSSDSLLFINQLQNQLEAVRKELSRRGIDLEAAHQLLQYEKDEKRVLKNRVEELLAYLERTKQLREGPDSAINMEYLKNCVFKFMSSSDLSEKRRLYPVIATILKLTSQEMRDVEAAFQATEERENEFQNAISSIGSFAASSFGSLWGSS